MEPSSSPTRTLSNQRIFASVAACRYSLSSIVARGLLLAGVVDIVAALPRGGKPRKTSAILLALAPVGIARFSPLWCQCSQRGHSLLS
jgi:hypothetical protein